MVLEWIDFLNSNYFCLPGGKSACFGLDVPENAEVELNPLKESSSICLGDVCPSNESMEKALAFCDSLEIEDSGFLSPRHDKSILL